MSRIVFISLFMFSSMGLCAQFWEEDFGTNETCGISDANGFVTSNGIWTVEATGANASAAHNWFVGPREAGMSLGECGNSCLSDPALINNTLYVSSGALNEDNGAVFQNNADTETHRRAVSPLVDFSGNVDTMVVNLEYIYSGHLQSTCVLEYFDGTEWHDLAELPETIGACGDAGEWSETFFELPFSLNGTPDVRFGIRWENTPPETMTTPELSVAINRIECQCKELLDPDANSGNPLDPTVTENPVMELDEEDCSTSYSETWHLTQWAADIFGLSSPVIFNDASAGANEMDFWAEYVLEAPIPGCSSQSLTLEISGGEVYGPDIIEDFGFFLYDIDEVCVGECVDFEFYPGVGSWFGIDDEIVYSLNLPSGVTANDVEMMWGSVFGTFCFESPGDYVILPSASLCGISPIMIDPALFTVHPSDVEAEVIVSSNDVCAGSCVTYSLDDPTLSSIQWSFPGGTPSTSNSFQPVQVCYNTPGTYNASVSFVSDGACGSGQTDDFVTVTDCGNPPTVAFSASSTTVCAGECVVFTDESTGTNIDTWSWSFPGGEPTASSNQNPEVCYQTPGIYSVELNVENIAGTDALSIPGYIEVIDCSDPPVAAFTVSETDICLEDCVSFTDQSGGTGNSWLWTFEGANPATSTDQHPANVCYDTPGAYTVSLTVTNPDGVDELTETAFIDVDPCYLAPEPSFSVSETTICEGECVGFTNSSTTTAEESWSWTFNGAVTPTSTEESPQNVCYNEPGTYSVTLSVTDVGGTESLTLNNLITVEECPAPNALFTVSQDLICLGECVQINNLSTGIITGYQWTFPEGISGDTTATHPELCFTEPGTYSISLLAFNDDGEESEYTLEQAVVVDSCLPQISIEVSEDRICVGDCVSFTNLSDEGASSWLWTFPGAVNTSSTQQNPAQVCYHTPGVFDVTLQADYGALTMDSTFMQFIHVIDSCGPEAGFDYIPIVCLGQCYDFENTSTGGTDFFWIFEGAEPLTSEDEHPRDICYLEETGIFNVVLTVSNQFGSSTSITQQITVVHPPNVNAGPDQTINQGTTTTLSAIAGNGTGNFIWQPFEDVTCFSCPATTTYPLNETTTFVVFYEQSGGCLSSDTVTVFVEESYVFGVPNSFSPNGDGVNDILYVRGSNITRLNFMIYNRYGEEVFSTTDQSKGWDGTKNGRELNAGVFGYYLEVFQVDGTRHEVKGDVTLVR